MRKDFAAQGLGIPGKGSARVGDGRKWARGLRLCGRIPPIQLELLSTQFGLNQKLTQWGIDYFNLMFTIRAIVLIMNDIKTGFDEIAEAWQTLTRWEKMQIGWRIWRLKRRQGWRLRRFVWLLVRQTPSRTPPERDKS